MALRMILISMVIFFLSACASLGIEPPNFHDGTWSDCIYTHKDGTTFAGPLQLGGAPLEFTKPNGIKVKCVAMPKAKAE